MLLPSTLTWLVVLQNSSHFCVFSLFLIQFDAKTCQKVKSADELVSLQQHGSVWNSHWALLNTDETEGFISVDKFGFKKLVAKCLSPRYVTVGEISHSRIPHKTQPSAWKNRNLSILKKSGISEKLQCKMCTCKKFETWERIKSMDISANGEKITLAYELQISNHFIFFRPSNSICFFSLLPSSYTTQGNQAMLPAYCDLRTGSFKSALSYRNFAVAPMIGTQIMKWRIG